MYASLDKISTKNLSVTGGAYYISYSRNLGKPKVPVGGTVHTCQSRSRLFKDTRSRRRDEKCLRGTGDSFRMGIKQPRIIPYLGRRHSSLSDNIGYRRFLFPVALSHVGSAPDIRDEKIAARFNVKYARKCR